MSREYESLWAPEPHRRQPRRDTARHRRRNWAPIAGVRIDGVHPSPDRFGNTGMHDGAKLGVASKDGRLRIAAPRSRPADGLLHRRHPSL